jgi:hypothetical protein
MPRCGCGDRCNCLIEVGLGLDISGTGNENNGYEITFDGGEVAGPGIAWSGSPELLSTRLSAGGGLGFDGAGGLLVTGAPGTSTGAAGPSVVDLETRGSHIVIGAMGAGYLCKPECLLSSFAYGQRLNLDAMHVPIRFVASGQPVVFADETMARTVGAAYGAASFWATQYVQEQAGHFWNVIPDEPGFWNPREAQQPPATVDPLVATNWNASAYHPSAPQFGWFGYVEPNQFGLTSLADVLRTVGWGTPLILHLQFPARDATTLAWIRPTPAWRTDIYLASVLALIRQFRLTNSVVVTTSESTIPGQAPGTTVNVLDYFSAAGIRVGPWIENAAAAARYPADGTWPASWTWAFCGTALTDVAVASYRDKVVGASHVKTVLFYVNRQTAWAQRVTTPGLLGAISGDPLYAAAASVPAGHPVGGHRYRRETSLWDTATVSHGQLGYLDTPNKVHAMLRGYHKSASTKLFLGPSMVSTVVGDYSYSLLAGWPYLADPTSWSVDITYGFDAFDSDRTYSYLMFTICRVPDSPYSIWLPVPAPTDIPEQSGYLIAVNQMGSVTLFGYLGGAVVQMAINTVPTAIALGVGQRLRIGVNANGLRARSLNVSTGATTKELWSVTTADAKAHRGRYMHLGRAAAVSPWVGWFDAFTLFPGGGAADGPP